MVLLSLLLLPVFAQFMRFVVLPLPLRILYFPRHTPLILRLPLVYTALFQRNPINFFSSQGSRLNHIFFLFSLAPQVRAAMHTSSCIEVGQGRPLMRGYCEGTYVLRREGCDITNVNRIWFRLLSIDSDRTKRLIVCLSFCLPMCVRMYLCVYACMYVYLSACLLVSLSSIKNKARHTSFFSLLIQGLTIVSPFFHPSHWYTLEFCLILFFPLLMT